jgi:hypothetical protein
MDVMWAIDRLAAEAALLAAVCVLPRTLLWVLKSV